MPSKKRKYRYPMTVRHRRKKPNVKKLIPLNLLDLPKSIWIERIFTILGLTVAIELIPLLLTCKAMSQLIKHCFCVHCGRIFASNAECLEYSTGYVGHTHRKECELPLAMDPFRDIYSHMDWHNSFVAGGWAAFLHFKEYRHYQRPCWRKGGEMHRRDMDIFFYNFKPAERFVWSIRTKEYQKGKYVTMLEKPSEWISELHRYTTPGNANAKMQFESGVVIDVVGRMWNRLNPLEILSTFDYPCVKVAFKWPDRSRPKQWILDDCHIAPFPSIPVVKCTEERRKWLEAEYGEKNADTSPEEWKNIIDKGLEMYLVQDKRQLERWNKYKFRGYDYAICDCVS